MEEAKSKVKSEILLPLYEKFMSSHGADSGLRKNDVRALGFKLAKEEIARLIHQLQKGDQQGDQKGKLTKKFLQSGLLEGAQDIFFDASSSSSSLTTSSSTRGGLAEALIGRLDVKKASRFKYMRTNNLCRQSHLQFSKDIKAVFQLLRAISKVSMLETGGKSEEFAKMKAMHLVLERATKQRRLSCRVLHSLQMLRTNKS